MKIVFARTIVKKEQITEVDITNITKAFFKGIFVKIKGEDLPRSSRLVKIYMTTLEGARRAVFLVDMESEDGFFLMYRSKNDEVGRNITIKNPKFKKLLWKYLRLLKEDIRDENYKVYRNSPDDV